MAALDIWVEGIADQKFLADVLKAWLNLSFDEKFNCVDEVQGISVQLRKGDGVSNFISEDGWNNIKPFFEENNAKGTKNLIIADADEDFERRKAAVAQTVKEVDFNSELNLFLWPDHRSHEIKGDLESLLEQIINPEHKGIFKCWDAYETCLRSSDNGNYNIPLRKAKIYAYLKVLLGEHKNSKNDKDKAKEPYREYFNEDHWNLDHTKEPLEPLYEFLKKHLIQPVGNNI